MDLLLGNSIIKELSSVDDAMVVGEDPGGNFFLIIGNLNYGVYYWGRTHLHYSGQADLAENEEEGDLYKVSDCFNDFYDLVLTNIKDNEGWSCVDF